MSADTPPTLSHITNALSFVASGLSTVDELWSTMAQDREKLHNTLKNFLANPTVLKLTAHSLSTPTAQSDELKEIKKNLATLIKTVNSLHQKVNTPPNQHPHPPPPRAKDTTKPSPPSYANVTASVAAARLAVGQLAELRLFPEPAQETATPTPEPAHRVPN